LSYVVIWRFEVRPERAGEFVEHYGPEGTWARFFRHSPEFIRTDLLRNGTEFVTLDWWRSERAFLDFESANRDEYRSIDAGFEQLTSREEMIGAYTVSS
jgi:hypothetical protein